jgi:hypothetical protein
MLPDFENAFWKPSQNSFYCDWSMLSGVGPLLAAVKMRQNLLVTDGLRCDFSEHLAASWWMHFPGHNRRCSVSEEGFWKDFQNCLLRFLMRKVEIQVSITASGMSPWLNCGCYIRWRIILQLLFLDELLADGLVLQCIFTGADTWTNELLYKDTKPYVGFSLQLTS